MVHNLTSKVTQPVTSLLGSVGPVISIAMDLHLILIWLMVQDNFTVIVIFVGVPHRFSIKKPEPIIWDCYRNMYVNVFTIDLSLLLESVVW